MVEKHTHIPFHGGHITWHKDTPPTKEEMESFEKMYKLAFNMVSKKYSNEFEPPFRVGKRQLRAVLDSKGKEVVVFPKNNGQAQLYCDYLNEESEIKNKFGEDNNLSKIPFPQRNDPTNCVVYCFMNLFNNKELFEEFLRENRGHNWEDEYKIINLRAKLFNSLSGNLYVREFANNAGSIHDSLTLSQIRNALHYTFDYEYDDRDYFVPIFATVASKKNMRGRHRVLFFDLGGENIILCDPQIDRFLLISLSDFMCYYKTIISIEAVMNCDKDFNIKVVHFRKEDFSHIPWINGKE